METLLLSWPEFTTPDEDFIDNYPKVVPDIRELTKYGISLSDIKETFCWSLDLMSGLQGSSGWAALTRSNYPSTLLQKAFPPGPKREKAGVY